MIDVETWKPVPSAPGMLASSHGRIMRAPCKVSNGKGVRSVGGEPYLGCWDGKRYIVRLNYLRKNFKVARMICEAFHGPAPEGKPLVLHGDENARNNRPDNLRWGTNKENLNEPGYLAYCRARTGESNPGTKGRRARAAAL